MNYYAVYPYNVLFFRGNKAFHFGEWLTEGVFPPLPSTFQGFVRSKILQDNDLLDEHGRLKMDAEIQSKGLVGDDNESNVDIIGPYLRYQESGDIFMKTPADIFKQEPGFGSVVSHLGSPIATDLDFNLCSLALPKEKWESVTPPEYISLKDLCKYRLGDMSFRFMEEEFYKTETRTGISLNYGNDGRRQTQEGRYFATPYNRLSDNVSLCFGIQAKNGNDIQLRGTSKIGSESHLVYADPLKDLSMENIIHESREQLVNKIEETKTLKMILLQPGIFKKGWFPFEGKTENGWLTAEVGGLKIKLLFALTGNPLNISGYSYRKNNISTAQKNINVKPNLQAVPTGSVYVFQILNNGNCKSEINAFIEAYDWRKINNEPYSNMGFNQVIMASCEKPTMEAQKI